jgi:hypothetical protein
VDRFKLEQERDDLAIEILKAYETADYKRADELYPKWVDTLKAIGDLEKIIEDKII